MYVHVDVTLMLTCLKCKGRWAAENTFNITSFSFKKENKKHFSIKIQIFSLYCIYTVQPQKIGCWTQAGATPFIIVNPEEKSQRSKLVFPSQSPGLGVSARNGTRRSRNGPFVAVTNIWSPGVGRNSRGECPPCFWVCQSLHSLGEKSGSCWEMPQGWWLYMHWGGVGWGGVGEGRGVVGKLGLLTLIHMQPDSSAICPDSNPSTRVSIFNFRDDILMFCFIGLFQEGFVFLFFS